MSTPLFHAAKNLAEVAGSPPGKPSLPQRQAHLYIALLLTVISVVLVWEYTSEHLPEFIQELFLFFALVGGLVGGSMLTSISYSLMRTEKSNLSLKDQTDFYEALLHAQSDLGEGLIIMEGDRIIYANDASFQITGYTADELAALPSFLLLVVPDQRTLLAERLRKRLAGKDVEEHYETAVIHKSGKHVELEIAIKKFYVGGTMRLVVIARDISERKKIDNAKSEFVSWVSHQLRTPLTASSFLAEMLLSGDDGKLTIEQMQSIQKIYDANQRMISLINALLNVARIELGTLAVERAPTSLSELADSVLEDLRPQIESKKIAIERTYDKSLPLMDIDPRLMRMVFQNLLSNAVKYTPAGTVAVKITRETQNAMIMIRDTGLGIPKDAQEKIFGKLFRADNVQSKDIEGTGLGLYIIRAVVQLFGGKIWFESEENKGTAFFVSLPFTAPSGKREHTVDFL